MERHAERRRSRQRHGVCCLASKHFPSRFTGKAASTAQAAPLAALLCIALIKH